MKAVPANINPPHGQHKAPHGGDARPKRDISPNPETLQMQADKQKIFGPEGQPDNWPALSACRLTNTRLLAKGGVNSKKAEIRGILLSDNIPGGRY